MLRTCQKPGRCLTFASAKAAARILSMFQPAPKYLAVYTTRPAVAKAPATAGNRVMPDIQGSVMWVERWPYKFAAVCIRAPVVA